MDTVKTLLALNPINNPALPKIANKDPEKDTPALFGQFLTGLIGILLVIGTIMALLQLLQGALEWITSGGDKTGLDNARNRITNALIGLVILFAAWSLFLVVIRFLGIDLLGQSGTININLPSLIQ